MSPYVNPYITVKTFSRGDVAGYCRTLGPQLHVAGLKAPDGSDLDGARLMWAISGCESSFGFNCAPRFEPIFFTGRYSHRPPMPALIALYGQAAAASYGPWQVLLCNSINGHPSDANDLAKCAANFIAHANGILRWEQPLDLDEFADAYNTGDWRVGVPPAEYVSRCKTYYATPMP